MGIRKRRDKVILASLIGAAGIGLVVFIWSTRGQDREELIRMEKLLFNQLALSGPAKAVTLPLSMQAHLARCFLGDIDAMNMEAQHSKNENYLLSLEPLLGKAKAATQPLTLKELSERFNREFQVPAVAQPQHYGLFICRDSQKKNRCLGKQAVDLNEIFTQYFNKKKSFTRYAAIDKIYFFQYILIDQDRAMILGDAFYQGMKKKSTRSYALMGQYLSRAYRMSKPQIKDLLKKVHRFNRTVASQMMTVKGDRIHFGLPKVSADCDLEVIAGLYTGKHKRLPGKIQIKHKVGD